MIFVLSASKVGRKMHFRYKAYQDHTYKALAAHQVL